MGRIVFLLVFSLFWGGLTFYTGFVVRISHDVLDDAMVGGLITQRVTNVLQGLGLLTVLFMIGNAIILARQSRRNGIALGAISLVMACTIAGLFVVHHQLDNVIDVDASTVTDYDAFRIGHRRYNQLTTIEWLASLTYIVVTVFAWRKIDSAKRTSTTILN